MPYRLQSALWRSTMSVQPNVNHLIKRTQRYEFDDGLREIQMGVMMLCYGLQAWLMFDGGAMRVILELRLQSGVVAMWAALIVFLMSPLLPVYGVLWVMGVIRRRKLWAKSGTVKPSRTVIPLWLNILSAAIMVGGLLAGGGLYLAGRVGEDFVWRAFWTAIGWGMGCTYYGMGRHIDLPRYRAVGIAGALLSTPVLALPLGFGASTLVLGAIWGILLTLSGGSAFRQAWQAAESGGDELRN